MRLYLDTADRSEAEPLLATGLFHGITTNPTILQRAGLGVADIPDVYAWATAAGSREVFFQAWGTEPDILIRRGGELRALGPDVVVKLPASRAGTTAAARLAAEGIPTLLTAVYAPEQAILAAVAGATYIAPYVGKLADAGRDGIGSVQIMQQILQRSGALTRILLASVRDVDSVVAAAQLGVDHFTMGPSVAETLFAEELTAQAVDTFEKAVASTRSQ